MNSGTTKQLPDYILLAASGSLVAIGVVMVYSASFVEAHLLQKPHYYYLLRQSIAAIIGLVGLMIAQRVHYLIWKRYAVALLGLALFLLVLVLILPETITKVNESRSWIRFGEGMVSFQPSEFAKLALIIYMASWLSQRSDRLSNVSYGLIPLAIVLGVVCGLVMLEPDRGTTVILLLIAGAIYFVAGANILHILGALGLSLGAFLLLIQLAQHNMRIEAFKDPWKYYSTYGYQPIHALYALGSGGIVGEGLGQARQKFQWLPQAHTDAIFAILGEELGMLGTLTILCTFLLIAWRGYRIALRVSDPFASLVATGITSWIFFQAMVNIAVVTSLIPFTGLTLPFLSYGGTSLIMGMVCTGILLNISRHAESGTQTEGTGREQTDAPTMLRSPALVAFVNQTRKAAALLPEWRGNWRTRLPSTRRRRRFADLQGPIWITARMFLRNLQSGRGHGRGERPGSGR